MGTAATMLRRGTARLPGGAPLLRDPVRDALAAVFGEVPFDPARAPGDPGLHGPGSATWQVLGEPAAIVGGVRGLIVQLLHPLAMAGVADHSAFETDTLGRLRRTSAYVTTTAFGALDDVLDISRAVRRRHVPVHGTAPDGRAYRAEAPELLAWVSLALTESFLATDAAYAPRPVHRAQADAFVREQSRVAALLDPRVDLEGLAGDAEGREALRTGRVPLPMIDEGQLPTTLAGLRARVADFEGELELTEQGRYAVSFLERPSLEGPTARAYRPVLAGALATLPADRRQRCGWPTEAWRDRAARTAADSLTAALRLGGGRLAAADAGAERAAMVPRR
jgi:hypothetical protein